MTRLQGMSTALLVMVVGGSAIATAQGDRGKRPAARGAADAKQQQSQDQQKQQQRVSAEEQRQRVQAQQQRDAQYRQHLDRQAPAVQQQAAQLQAQQRMAQYRVQQEYAAKLRQQQQEQQQRLRAARDYANDPYTSTPNTYRYRVGGTARQTNQYGADVLRQAVNYGYQQGVRAGEADRQDRRPANYKNTIAYRDANYGYGGNYVDQSDYNYYFREGFRRGYEDGYGGRSQYGTTTNGTTSILGSLLTGILGLQSIR